MRQQPMNSSYSSVTRWVLVAILVVILLLAAWAIRGILLLLLSSIILVVTFSMPVRYLGRRGVPRAPAIVLSLIFFTLLVITLMALALPELVRQFTTLATVNIPQGVQALVERWNSGDIQQQFPFLQSVSTEDITSLLNQLSGQIASALGQLGVSVLPVLGGVADTVLSILIVVFLSLYLLVDPQMHQEGLVRLFPISYRYRVREIISRLDETLRGWLRATLFSMIFVGVATWGGLAILGLQQAAALGVLAGMLAFIPNFGPILALIPSIAVGVTQTPGSLGWIVVIIYGVSFIQSQIVTPLLVAGSIKIPPVLVLLGQIIAGVFGGFLGLVLAVPITAILIVLVQEVYIKDVLGDRQPLNMQEKTTPFKEKVLVPDRA
ncbi:MAG: AI-2E family transporter [Aggregatilineales bacterium]